MALDDDLFVVSMTTKGWVSVVFALLMIAAMYWQCSQEKKCGPDAIYIKDNNICVDKSAILKPGEVSK